MKKFLLPIVSLVLFSSACKKNAVDKNLVYVTILPQKYLVERIAGNDLKVKVMIPPGHSPATYEPTSKQMIELSKAALYFRIGHVPFEKAQIDNIESANSSLEIIDTSEGVKLIKGVHHHHEEGENHKEHDEHHQDEKNHKHHADHDDHDDHHKEAGVDPHIWLSPKAVKIMSKNIYQALVKHDAVNKDKFQNNYKKLIKDIDNLDKRLHKILHKVKNREFIVYHPAWTYFAHDYKLKQMAIEKDGKAPAADYIREIIQTAKKHKIKVVFVQKEFATNNAKAIAKDIGGKVIQLSPLEENWLINMEKIAKAFSRALR